jgi:hypothetical protein
MTDKKIKFKVEFAPGAFDSFEGTQEEMNEMIREVQELFSNMTLEDLQHNDLLMDLSELKESDPELYEQVINNLVSRKLH